MSQPKRSRFWAIRAALSSLTALALAVALIIYGVIEELFAKGRAGVFPFLVCVSLAYLVAAEAIRSLPDPEEIFGGEKE